MNKAKPFLLQVLISVIVVALWWTFFVAKQRGYWERVYERSDLSVVEIYALTVGDEDIGLQSGTGFVFNLHGKLVILTNRHVASAATVPYIRFQDGVDGIVQILDASGLHDLAVLESQDISLKRYGSLFKGNSQDLRIGEEVMTIGHPKLESHHISVGFYSGKFTDKRGRTLLRLSMAVDPGNSGGPLFNKKGQVVGVISQKVKKSTNIAFAIPIEKVQSLHSVK
jgi:S1-C subfamily serine protease